MLSSGCTTTQALISGVLLEGRNARYGLRRRLAREWNMEADHQATGHRRGLLEKTAA
jgi:hypothetical protein